ncbi:hypothetical protein ACFO1B_14800 [Dactylosporangium siamense]|uniref:FtsX-like permease family protein n=1 Tax=Dactylosporangium siamense TaxID=685454 RepID=A0A919UB15_9ACTN|nr:hypothetical protein [Dactylosporangium siamense]GIG45101.1 hypothetical protein Dsi01nite_031420 [Dactylosporangium siamense]
MIALTLAVLWARRRQAAALFVLAALATGGVALAPVYLARVEAGIVADKVALARADERAMLVAATVEPDTTGAMDQSFERQGARLLDPPGYTQVFSASFVAQPAQRPAVFLDGTRQVTYRQDVCEHVQVVSGRCLMSLGDAVLTEDTARRLEVRLGDPMSLTASAYNSSTSQFVLAGPPGFLTVVGIVRPISSPYWGRGSDAPAIAPVYVDRRTLDGFSRPSELQVFDAYPQPGAISLTTLSRLRAWLAQVDAAGTDGKASIGLGDLLDRIDADRAAAREPVPFAAIPVALLGCAVLVLAAATGARASRFEHGVVALRGTHRAARWWLASAEPVIPVLAGGLAGGLTGSLIAGAGALTALGYGAGLTVAAVLASAIVAIRAVSAPLSDLLRRVDRRAARWRSATFDVLVGLLAVVAVTHFHASGDSVYGVAPLAPALLMLAVAVLAARAMPLLAARAGASALRRGRLVPALAALRLARQPAGRRVLTVLVAAVALLGFATTGVTVAVGSQQARADTAIGASRVLSIAPTTRQRLLAITRAADPQGRYAMAVVPFKDLLAVDATRLPAVAVWHPSYADDALPDLARALHPIPAAPAVAVRGDTVAFDITASRLDGLTPDLVAHLAPLDGAAGVEVRLGELAPGRHMYSGPAPCTAGCRLAGLEVDLTGSSGPTVTLTLHGPLTRDWRTPPDATVTAAGDGVRFELHAGARRDAGLLRPAGVPDRIPVLPTGPLPPDGLLDAFDDTPIPATAVATARNLPRLGRNGVLIDLEYADRLAGDSGSTQGAEVWLASDAPPAVVDALTAAGLTVTGERTLSGERALLSRTGGALGMRFSLLAGVAAAVLGAAALLVTVAGGDRADLTALRRQGAPARMTRRVERAAALALVAVALVVGSAAAVVAWFAVGRYLPAVDPGYVPPPGPLLLSLCAAAALLGAGALVGARSRGSG